LWPQEYHIRALERADLDAVLTIEQASYSQPWTREQFEQELNNPAAFLDGCAAANRLAGYICYWLIAGEMQILNIATARQFRRQGIAQQLLDHAFNRCAEQGLSSAWLEVRAGNTAALTLYQSSGFKTDGRRRAYYRDGEDALLMVREFKDQKFQE
jgi:ribosomal-protein-alanine N-acetyltransferase